MQYDGEVVSTLTGSEEQRSVITRGRVGEQVVLVGDDARAGVDTATEGNCLRSLRGGQGRHTHVSVSHRVSAVQEGDLVLVMEQGKVVQRGTHEALVGEEGLYADLYEKQLLEEEIQAL